MPFRNRVTPFGDIVVDPGRGTLMGNRGVLHDADRRIVRDSQVRRWIACRLEFRGRWRPIMRPGHYTELFFLDEAAAFAAGHRPCAECRHADYRRFLSTWRQVLPDAEASADAIDRRLHAERRSGPWQKRTYRSAAADLPQGTYVAVDHQAWLLLADRVTRWTAAGYVASRARPTGEVTVLTPPALVAVMRSGYAPAIHASARRAT